MSNKDNTVMREITGTCIWKDSDDEEIHREGRCLMMTIWVRDDMIEDPPGVKYKVGEIPILDFVGGPTGNEKYRVMDLVKDQRRGEVFAICFGSPGSWPRCEVPWNEVVQFLADNGYTGGADSA